MDDRTIRSIFERQPAQEVQPGQEPGELDLSPEDQEKIRSARDLLGGLIKTFKAYRLYLANNDLLQRFQSELVQKFQDYLKRFSDLELRVRPATLTVMGQAVYRSQEEGDNISAQLYRDGFRRITFHEGLPNSEILGFIEVLKKTFERTTDIDFDAVTLFWEKDFKYITYHAVEELLPEGVDPTQVDQQADAQIDRIVTLSHNTMEDALTSGDALFDLPEDNKRQDIYDNVAPSEESVIKSQLVQSFLALETSEIKKIHQQIRTEKPEDLLIDMADVIIEVIYLERSFADFQMLVESLEQILAMYFELLDLERGTEILKRLHQLAEGYRSTSAKAAEYIDKVIERSGTEGRLERLFTALKQGRTFPITTLGTFLVHLGASAIPAICRSLNETTHQELRKNLCDVLVLLGRRFFEPLMTNLDEQSERGLRNKIYVLSRIEHESVFPFFRKHAKNANPAIRQLVLAALARFYNPVTRDLLTQSLQDGDAAVRIAAVKVLAQSHDPKALDVILPVMREARFHEKDMAEKRVFFGAMALLGGNDLTESLGQILMTKALRDPDLDDEARICAAEALGLIGTDEAIAQLSGGLKTKRKAIIQACQEQINMIHERRGANG